MLRSDPSGSMFPRRTSTTCGTGSPRTRWPDELPDVGWSRGVPLGYLKEPRRVLAHPTTTGGRTRPSSTSFPSSPPRSTARRSTSCTSVRPSRTRCRWSSPTGTRARSPSSCDLIGPLTDPRAHGGDPADAFHVVAPSLPGFGFSSPLADTGWELARTAKAWVELMRRLGYERYGAHGGDIGAGVSGDLGIHDPDRVVGAHVDDRSERPRPDRRDAARRGRGHDRRAEGPTAGTAGLGGRRPRLPADPDHPAANARVRAQRFAGTPARLDRGEVQGVDESRRRPPRGRRRPRPAAHQRQHLLVHRHGGVGRPTSSTRRPTPSGTGERCRRRRPGWRCSRPTTCSGTSSTATGTSSTGRSSKRGGHFPAMEAPDLLVGDIRKFFRAPSLIAGRSSRPCAEASADRSAHRCRRSAGSRSPIASHARPWAGTAAGRDSLRSSGTTGSTAGPSCWSTSSSSHRRRD